MKLFAFSGRSRYCIERSGKIASLSIGKRISAYLLSLGLCALLFISGCKPSDLFYFPDHMAKYLEVTADQQDTVMPALENIRAELISFYQQTREMPSHLRSMDDRQMSWEKIEVLQESTWETLREAVEDLAPQLRPAQAQKLKDLPLPKLTFEERVNVSRTLLQGEKFSLRRKARVVPTLSTDAAPPIETYDELWDAWTLRFGNRNALGFGDGGRGGRTRFPLFIHATLMDPALLQMKESGDATVPHYPWHQDEIEVRITLESISHDSFMDLNNWIIFLEADEMTQAELLRHEAVDSLWIPVDPSHGLMFRGTGEVEFTGRAGMTAGGGMGMGGGGYDNPHQSMRGRSGMSRLQRQSYRLLFPATTAEGPLISDTTQELKLVFLRDVQDEERAEGTWAFSHR
jgi:hypothetical protein